MKQKTEIESQSKFKML